jgi:hypothetical protein
MQPERRRQMVLAVVVVVLAFALYRAWPRTAAPTTATSNPRGMARGGQTTDVAAPDVKLEALEAERPKPEGSMRNLVRFGRPPGAPAPAAPQVPGAAAANRPDHSAGTDDSADSANSSAR